MAEGDNKSNIGAADETEGVSYESPSKIYRPLAGPSLPVVFGRPLGGGAVITSVMVDGRTFGARENPAVNLNSKIEIFGKNLDAFDEWQIQQTGRNPINLDEPVREGGFKAIFDISKRLADRLPEGANFGITLFGSKVGGRRRILPLVFVFQAKAEEKAGAESKTGAEAGGALAGAGAPSAAGGGGGLDLAGLMTQVGGEAMAGVLGGVAAGLKAGARSATSQRPAQTLEKIAASGKFAGGRGEAEVDFDADIEGRESVEGIAGGEVEASVQAKAAPETIRQSAELVGEYIDKNPGIIADVSSRAKILGALQSGNLGSLSAQEHASLQAAVKAISGSPAGAVDAQVQSAAKMVQNASLDMASSIKPPASAGAAAGRQAASQGTTAGAAAVSINLKDSMDVVGEYLDKNPQAIPDVGARNRILQALQSGNLDSLPEADKKLLTNILRLAATAPNQPLEVRAAMQTVMNAAAGKGQPGQEPLRERLAGAPPEPSRVEEKPAALGPLSKAEGEGKGRKGEGEAPKVAVPPEVQKEIDALKAREKPLLSGLGLPAKPSPLSPGELVPSGAAVPGGAKVPGALGKEAPSGAKAGEGEAPAAEKAGPPLPPPAQEPTGPQRGGGPAKPEEGAGPQGVPPAGRPSESPSRPIEKSSFDQKPQPSGEREEARRGKPAIAAAAESEALKEASIAANKALNAVLLEGVAWVWAAAIPSFGLSILVGAFVGDLIWLFKGLILNRIAPNSSILKKFKDQSFQIKLSGAVKVNIMAMNLAAIALVFLLVVVVFGVIWGICNSWITYPARKSSDFNQVCKAIEQGAVGQALSSVRSSGTFTASNNTPGDLMGTAKWTQAINTYAQKWNIDACILKVVVQKESGGRELAIGCDCAANGKPSLCTPFDPAAPPLYNLNWDQCSHGIGLTQWTIYPRGSTESYKRWLNSEVPTRNILGQWYSATDLFLRPELSLDLTARAFSQNLSKARGDVRAAFAAYVGQSSRTNQLVDDRMALYNLCVAQR